MHIPYKLTVLTNKLLEANCGPIHRAGNEFRCRCPAHDDHRPSFYIRATDDKVLIRCSSGCTFHEVCDRLDLDPGDLSLGADEPWVETDDSFHIINMTERGEVQSPEANEPEAAAPSAGSVPPCGVP